MSKFNSKLHFIFLQSDSTLPPVLSKDLSNIDMCLFISSDPPIRVLCGTNIKSIKYLGDMIGNVNWSGYVWNGIILWRLVVCCCMGWLV